MNSGARIIATISVSILLASAVFADDTPKSAVKAAKDEAAKFSETSRAPDKSNNTPAGKSSFPGSLWGSDDKTGTLRASKFFLDTHSCGVYKPITATVSPGCMAAAPRSPLT
jgi:hypothetical protein